MILDSGTKLRLIDDILKTMEDAIKELNVSEERAKIQNNYNTMLLIKDDIIDLYSLKRILSKEDI